MKLDIYVNYAGLCEEAFRFYEQHLGIARLLTGSIRAKSASSAFLPEGTLPRR